MIFEIKYNLYEEQKKIHAHKHILYLQLLIMPSKRLGHPCVINTTFSSFIIVSHSYRETYLKIMRNVW